MVKAFIMKLRLLYRLSFHNNYPYIKGYSEMHHRLTFIITVMYRYSNGLMTRAAAGLSVALIRTSPAGRWWLWIRTRWFHLKLIIITFDLKIYAKDRCDSAPRDLINVMYLSLAVGFTSHHTMLYSFKNWAILVNLPILGTMNVWQAKLSLTAERKTEYWYTSDFAIDPRLPRNDDIGKTHEHHSPLWQFCPHHQSEQVTLTSIYVMIGQEIEHCALIGPYHHHQNHPHNHLPFLHHFLQSLHHNLKKKTTIMIFLVVYTIFNCMNIQDRDIHLPNFSQ